MSSLAAAHTSPLVSVVVIGRNEGARLRLCLQSIAAMELDGFRVETIYVDSASVDGSLALAQSYGAQVIALHPRRPTAALGRNAGWRAASGSLILFLDGDTILHPRFLADSLSEFALPEIAVVWGNRKELHPERSVYNRVLNLDWVYPPGFTSFCGGDALFRRDVLAAAGGYDETLIAGEEPELCRRIAALGYRILHLDRPMTLHDLAITRWRQYWKRATRAGHAYAEVSERFRNTASPFWQAETRQNRNRVVMLLSILLAGVAGSFGLLNPVPLLAALLLLALLALRSAWKARWKSQDAIAILLYGIHSHLQQLPIFVGQLQYRWTRSKGEHVALLEYK